MAKPVWISHRGYHQKYPENSLAAFSEAVRFGFTALETDLRISADGHLVLMHDPDLERVAGIKGAVNELTRSELEGVRLPGDHRILFFEEFAEVFSELQWTLDIKAEHGWESLSALYYWNERNGRALVEHCRFLLWDREQQEACRGYFPQAQFYGNSRQCYWAALPALTGLPPLSLIKKGWCYAVPPSLLRQNLFRKELVHRYHMKGAKVVAYLPDSSVQARQAVEAGFDEILTNHKIVPC